jgi:hypothetical protein
MTDSLDIARDRTNPLIAIKNTSFSFASPQLPMFAVSQSFHPAPRVCSETLFTYAVSEIKFQSQRVTTVPVVYTVSYRFQHYIPQTKVCAQRTAPSVAENFFITLKTDVKGYTQSTRSVRNRNITFRTHESKSYSFKIYHSSVTTQHLSIVMIGIFIFKIKT